MLQQQDSGWCWKCGSLVKTDNRRGRIVCDNCGLVKEISFIDPQSEYRYFTENQSSVNDPRRVGSTINTFMDAQIDLIDIDDGKNSYHVYASLSNADKYFNKASKLIKKYCQIVSLPVNIIKYAENIFFDVQDKQELRGKNIEHIVIACIYLACKRNLVNIHPVALEPLADISQNKILKICKVILKFIPKVCINSSQYADMFCQKLNISKEFWLDIQRICKEIENWDFFDKQLPKPKTIAAAVIYFYTSKLPFEYNKNLIDIKEAAGIQTDLTIKKYYKDLENKIDHLNKVLGKDLNCMRPIQKEDQAQLKFKSK